MLRFLRESLVQISNHWSPTKDTIPLMESVQIFFQPKRIWCVCLLLVGLGGFNTAAAETELAFPADPALEDYLVWAHDHSPRIAAGAARASALREDSRRVGALPNLKLAWGEMIVPVETRVGPQQRVLSISQSFPWFGSLSARENSLSAAADAAEMTVRDQVYRSENDVRAAWYELTHIDGQKLILAHNLQIAEETEVVVQARYETGVGSYMSLLNIQMEIGRHATRLAGLEDQLLTVTTRLNIAAGLNAYRAAPKPRDFNPEVLSVELPTTADLTRAMWRLSPFHGAMQYQERSRRHGVEAAGHRAYPDLTLGVDYIMTGDARMPDVQDSGKDPVIARIAVSLPLWGGAADAEQKASAGHLREARANLSDARLQMTGKLEQAMFEWREAGRNRELYSGSLLPRSQQNLQVITASYQAGAVHFDDLQEAREIHLALELALLRANADRMLALNDVASLVGVTVEQLIHADLDALPSLIEEK